MFVGINDILSTSDVEGKKIQNLTMIKELLHVRHRVYSNKMFIYKKARDWITRNHIGRLNNIIWHAFSFAWNLSVRGLLA